MNNQTSVKAYRYTVLAMKILEKILGSKITVEGIENIPAKPVLFVCNHFTRSETFVVPYIIHKHTQRQVRCLADSGLFQGALGRFLRSVGALSTKDKKRDASIIADLISGKHDWMIYPEGSMIKSKEINIDGKFISYVSENSDGSILQNRVRTGSAVLALKSELYRAELVDAKRKDRSEVLKFYKQEFGIDFEDNFKQLQTSIVPLTITYYPIRPGRNFIQTIAAKIFKRLPKQIAEELEIEGNLLLSSNINISFGKAINLTEYVKNTRALIYQIPIIKSDTKANMVLKYLKYRLTSQFMNAIYANTQINIDHLVAAILHFYPQDQINIYHFKALIYLAVNHIAILKKYRINQDIVEEKLYKILGGENFEEFASVVNLAEMIGILKISEDKKTYLINKSKLAQRYDFQQIRLENTLQVILNEFLLLEGADDVIKRLVLFSDQAVRQKSFNYIFAKDIENFQADYKKHYDVNLSKNQTVGTPSFLDNAGFVNKNNIGILLVHGYLSAPKEMEDAAKYFNNLGFKTYCVRLKGHGTAPINIENTKWQDWYESLDRGYAALKLLCDQVFIVGFSTGALLAMIAASRKDHLDGIVCINPALKIRDSRAKFASKVHIWNDILDKFHINKGQLRYVENHPENSDINYSQNYIEGVEQLELLMNYCGKNLSTISCPTLIIQSNEDPTVDVIGSREVLEKIAIDFKEFLELERSNHVIVRGQGSDEVFGLIEEFLFRINK